MDGSSEHGAYAHESRGSFDPKKRVEIFLDPVECCIRDDQVHNRVINTRACKPIRLARRFTWNKSGDKSAKQSAPAQKIGRDSCRYQSAQIHENAQMRNAVPMRAGCRAWIKDGKEAQEEAQRRALREREMPWKTLWIRCGPQPLGTEKHDPGQQVCPRELCPHGTVQIACRSRLSTYPQFYPMLVSSRVFAEPTHAATARFIDQAIILRSFCQPRHHPFG